MVATVASIDITLRTLGAENFSSTFRRSGALVEQEGRRMTTAMAGVEKSSASMSAAMSRVGDRNRGFEALSISALRAQSSVKQLENSLYAVSALAGGLGGAFAARALVNYADGYTTIRNRLNSVIENQRESLAVEKELFDIAQRSRTQFGATATMFTRLTLSAKELGGATRESLLQATETTQKALITGGATTQEAASIATQLSQALGSGRLQGDELRSIAENSPILIQAIAREFGVAVGALKDMGSEGQLTSERVFRAILNAGQEVEAAFARTTPTVANGIQQIDNALTRYIGTLDKSLGATESLAKGLKFIADNLASIGDAALLAGGALTAAFAMNRLGALSQAMSRAGGGARTERQNALDMAMGASAAAKAELAAREQRLVDAAMSSTALNQRFRQNPEAFSDKQALRDREQAIRRIAELEKGVAADREKLNANRERIRAIRPSDVPTRLLDNERQAQARLTQTLADRLTVERQIDEAKRMALTTAARASVAPGFEREARAAERNLDRLQKRYADLGQEADKQSKRLSDASQRIVDATSEANRKAQIQRAEIGQRNAALEASIIAQGRERRLVSDLQGLSQREIDESSRRNFGEARAQAAQRQAVAISAVGAAQKAVSDADRALSSSQAAVAQGLTLSGRAADAARAAMSGLAAAGSAVVGFLGGPLGAALTAATVALIGYEMYTAKAARAAEDYKKAIEDLPLRIREINKATQEGRGLTAGQAARTQGERAQLRAGLRQELSTLSSDTGSSIFFGAGRGIRTALRDVGFDLDFFSRAIKNAERDTASANVQLGGFIAALERVALSRPDVSGDAWGLIKTAEKVRENIRLIEEFETAANRSAQVALRVGGQSVFDQEALVGAELAAQGAVGRRTTEFQQAAERAKEAAEAAKPAIDALAKAMTDGIDGGDGLDAAARAGFTSQAVDAIQQALSAVMQLRLTAQQIDSAPLQSLVQSFVTGGVQADEFKRRLEDLARGDRAFEGILKGATESADNFAKAKSEVDRLQAAINALTGKTVNIVLRMTQTIAGPQVASGDPDANANPAMDGLANRLISESNMRASERLRRARLSKGDRALEDLRNEFGGVPDDMLRQIRDAEETKKGGGRKSQGERDAETLAKKLKELEQDAAVAGLRQIDQQTVRFAQSAKVAKSEIDAFIQALKSGDTSNLPTNIQRIREELEKLEANKFARGLLDELFPARKMAEQLQQLKTAAESMPEVAANYDLLVERVRANNSGDFGKGIADAFGDFAGKAITDFNNIGDAFQSLAKRIVQIGVELMVVNPLKRWLQSTFADVQVGGGAGGGILGSIFSGVGGWLKGLFGFDEGGFTGVGARLAPAGIVHRGEYVFSAPAVSKAGVGVLDMMHKSLKGYADGGYVGATLGGVLNARGGGAAMTMDASGAAARATRSPVVVQPTVNVHNYAGAEVETEAGPGGSLEVFIKPVEQAVAGRAMSGRGPLKNVLPNTAAGRKG